MASSMELAAFFKSVFHALKYPYATVGGILLGKESGGKLKLIQYIPIYHIHHGLTPMLEVALLEIFSYSEKHNLSIVGYCQANSNYHETAPDSIACKLGEKLLEINDKASIYMLDGLSLGNWLGKNETKENIFVQYKQVDGKWKSTNIEPTYDKELYLDYLKKLVFTEQLHQSVEDFDSHLENISANWLNPHIDQRLELL